MESITTDKITIGARTRHEIELRITELQHRHKPSSRDLHELARLQEFLRSVAPRDGNHCERGVS
jgi:hypothetical protein